MKATKSLPAQPQAEMPPYLVYEVSKGKPIHWKGHKEFLSKNGGPDWFKLESSFQAWIKCRLSFTIGSQLQDMKYGLLTGAVNIQTQLSKKYLTDLVILRNEDFDINDQYLIKPPITTVEIDFWQQHSMDYVLEKVTDYHNFGVQKVIWIFTKNKKVMVATPGQPWLTLDWSVDIEAVEELVINLADIVAKKKG